MKIQFLMRLHIDLHENKLIYHDKKKVVTCIKEISLHMYILDV